MTLVSAAPARIPARRPAPRVGPAAAGPVVVRGAARLVGTLLAGVALVLVVVSLAANALAWLVGMPAEAMLERSRRRDAR
ncbi:hypothetical protein [Cellulomonas sp.]|uniref:hypothetical protein n=1 Tax=Cellulomonas sp. TaxID=40001 RepID=UPI0025911F29|nr:hypothetical protein [Cellulomonas sp.]MCR6689083.1 hypothetical protein [Cellulomonas sp.]